MPRSLSCKYLVRLIVPGTLVLIWIATTSPTAPVGVESSVPSIPSHTREPAALRANSVPLLNSMDASNVPAKSGFVIDVPKSIAAIDVATRSTYHRFANDLGTKRKRDMGNTADAAEQTIALGHIVRQYKPDASTICELGFNLGHSAATILTALDSPKRYIAFDFGEDVVVEVCARITFQSLPLLSPPSYEPFRSSPHRRPWTS